MECHFVCRHLADLDFADSRLPGLDLADLDLAELDLPNLDLPVANNWAGSAWEERPDLA